MQSFFYLLVFLTISFVVARDIPGTRDDFIVMSEEEEEEARLALQNPDVYEGDISGIDPFDPDRNAIVQEYFRWPGAKIPYVIDPSVDVIKGLIHEAIRDYHDKTCVRFVPRTEEEDYVKIFAGTGCFSDVGRRGGEQELSLSKGCHYLGTIIHELGHAVGFHHEHNRSDRDDYLEIFWENVRLDRTSQFRALQKNENILYNEFDSDSIMMYGNKAFSKNKKDTMRSKDGKALKEPYEKKEMTESDADRVNKMYHCKK